MSKQSRRKTKRVKPSKLSPERYKSLPRLRSIKEIEKVTKKLARETRETKQLAKLRRLHNYVRRIRLQNERKWNNQKLPETERLRARYAAEEFATSESQLKAAIESRKKSKK